MLTPALAALITRFFFYEPGFSDSYLKPKPWSWKLFLMSLLQFWALSLVLVVCTFFAFTLLGAISWDFTGQTFLNNLEKQFALSGKTMEETLPAGFTPQIMLILYTIGNLTFFNVLPGLINGIGEEFGRRGIMFTLFKKYSIGVRLLLGGAIWFLWHAPLQFVLPMPHAYTPKEFALNSAILLVGSVCTHTYFSFVLAYSHNIWASAIAHIAFNNISAAFAFYAAVKNQTLANLGIVIVMLLVTLLGWLSGLYPKTFRAFSELSAEK
jgi:hypothetical protein